MSLIARNVDHSRHFAKVLCLAVLLPVLLLPVHATKAQDVGVTAPRRAPGGELPPVVKKVFGSLLAAFGSPLHLIVGGAAPGSGLGGGIGLDSPSDAPWHARVKAVVTPRRYWVTEAEVEFRSDRLQADAYARLRDMPQLGFYGIGNETVVEDRTNFGMREGVVGLFGTARVAPWVTLGARVEENWANLGRGRATQYPSIETRFGANDVPGMTGRAKYARYEASVNVRVPAALGAAFYQGARYRIAYSYYDDQLTDQFTFARLDVEAQQRFAMPIPRHTLTLHGWVSAADAAAGQETPFYLQRTLGGKSFARSLHDDIISSDGSAGTLRGFTELRFRDRNLLLLQAEYRIPVWLLFDATVYVDAGKVAHDRSDLGLADLKHSFGFSLSAMKGNLTAARVDFAFGGGEGYRLFFTIGHGEAR